VGTGLPLDWYAASRWLGYLGLFVLIGSCVFRGIARGALVEAHGDAPLAAELAAGCRRTGLAAASLLLLSAFLRLYFQARTALDPGDSMSFAAITPWFEGPGSWGLMWMLQAGAGLVALAGMALAARRSNTGWTLAVAGALGAAITMPLTGHAIESRLGGGAGVALQGLHVLGGGVWLGTLFVLLYVTLRATRRDAGERERIVAGMVHAYSPIALVGAGTAVAVGVVLAWLNVGSFGALLSTDYGRALLIKLALVAGVAGVGAYNWQRLRPALGASPGARRLRFSATVELLIGAALLAVTAVLVVLASPRL
jgi:putative copper export protein